MNVAADRWTRYLWYFPHERKNIWKSGDEYATEKTFISLYDCTAYFQNTGKVNTLASQTLAGDLMGPRLAVNQYEEEDKANILNNRA